MYSLPIEISYKAISIAKTIFYQQIYNDIIRAHIYYTLVALMKKSNI